MNKDTDGGLQPTLEVRHRVIREIALHLDEMSDRTASGLFCRAGRVMRAGRSRLGHAGLLGGFVR